MKITTEKYKLGQEVISSVLYYRELQRTKNQLLNFLVLYDQKGLKEDFNNFVNKILIPLPLLVGKKSKQIVQVGFNNSKKQFKEKTENIKINWGLKNDEATIYIKNLTDLHLSQKNGSISRTTKLGIIDIIGDGIDEGLSYGEIARQIKKKDPFIFSKARSELIAVTEVGRAYEYGNFLPMQELQNKGEQVKKQWITAGDERVRPSHRQNGNDGWIDLNVPFSGTQTNIAPESFRCRCATIYDII